MLTFLRTTNATLKLILKSQSNLRGLDKNSPISYKRTLHIKSEGKYKFSFQLILSRTL